MHLAAVSGSRADWGLLSMPLRRLREAEGVTVSLILTGQHLAAGEESSLSQIERDHFVPVACVDIDTSDDSAAGITRSTSLAIAGIGASLAQLKPDLLMILGDRYEIFASAAAAACQSIPVAHLCGGDVTEGALDDALRHAITKLSHVHFVTNAEAARRVGQMGEDPANIHCVGSPGLDRIRQTPLLSREKLFASVGLVPRRRNLLVTYHPVTLDDNPLAEASEVMRALDRLGPEVGIIFTGANADRGGKGIDTLVAQFVAEHDHAVAHRTLGGQRYYSAIAHTDAVVGNSSSGLYEVPSFRKPTVNIGDRQKGRLRASSVIDCEGQTDVIVQAVEAAFALDCSGAVNPYGDGHTSERIVAVLQSIRGATRGLLRKGFVDLREGMRP